MTRAIQDFDSGEIAEMFDYLDDLRESGATNMYGAGVYIKSQFPDLARDEEHVVLKAWMNTFSEEPIDTRVFKALEIPTP